jgi:hypothetical protein
LGIDKHSWFIDPQITFGDMIHQQHQSNNIKVTATATATQQHQSKNN